MLKEIKNIIEGWSNVFGGNSTIKAIASYRFNICMTINDGSPCKKMNKFGYVCMACGCPLKGKTASMGSKCKLNHWEPVDINKLSKEDVDHYNRQIS